MFSHERTYGRDAVRRGWPHVGLHCSSLLWGALALLLCTAAASGQPVERTDPLRPGEAFVTRFSGAIGNGPGASINLDGVVGSIIDLRSPQQPPQGQHWIDEPQRAHVRAGEVGQVFGVAIDDATPPNIYLTATSAFGLHLAPGGHGWMAGMWGRGGGPGTIYKLDAREGYRPRPFADIRLNGRPNSGPALGNIAFDAANQQFLVSDLETGFIHRIRATDGADLGAFDHGTQGRARFIDAASGRPMSLPPIPFNPSSAARLADCPTGRFERQPECWNFAPSGRRVWGIGVWTNPMTAETRLYYAVWSGPAFGDTSWINLPEEEKRNAVWSVGLAPGGEFDRSSVRREFELPDFFVSPQDIARAGYSHPVSDITFSQCGERPVMLVAERGGIRNLGLTEENAFSYPHESRALRYELDRGGAWRPVGRYDVGFYDRKKEGQPFIRSNCSGGIAFGPGYSPESWTVDLARRDEFVWMSGHALCSPEAPCSLPDYAGATASAPAPTGPGAQSAAAQQGGEETALDDSEVHGIQGMAETAFEEIAPAAAFAAYPKDTDPYPATGPAQAYLIDTDANVDASGGLIEDELVRNDATRIGDIAIYQPCAAPRGEIRPAYLLPVPTPGIEPPYLVGHPRDLSHARIASHGAFSSHNRFGSHNPFWSHSRFGSHNTYWSHSRDGSHGIYWSHNRLGSHSRRESHNRYGSHSLVTSHFRFGSHSARASHSRVGSHTTLLSHNLSGSHNLRISHNRLGSHNLSLSHARLSSHTTALSHSLKGSHNLALSHSKLKSHSVVISKGPIHSIALSKGPLHTIVQSKVHNPAISQGQIHTVIQSKGPLHTTVQSKAHNPVISQGQIHTVIQSKGPAHTTVQSKAHNPAISQGQIHTVIQSKGPAHTTVQSKAHNPVISKGQVHSVIQSKGPGHSVALSKATVKEPVIKQPEVTAPKLLDTKKLPPPKVLKEQPPKVLKETPPKILKDQTPKVLKEVPPKKTHTEPKVLKTPTVKQQHIQQQQQFKKTLPPGTVTQQKQLQIQKKPPDGKKQQDQ